MKQGYELSVHCTMDHDTATEKLFPKHKVKCLFILQLAIAVEYLCRIPQIMTRIQINHTSHTMSNSAKVKFCNLPVNSIFSHKFFFLKQNFENAQNFMSSKVRRPMVLSLQSFWINKTVYSWANMLNCVWAPIYVCVIGSSKNSRTHRSVSQQPIR